MAHPVQVKLGGGAVQQLDLVHQLLVEGGADQAVQVGIPQLHLGGRGRLGTAVAGKVDDLPAAPVVDALKIFAAANGPVDGVGLDPQLLLQLFQQLEGIPGLPVHLVDEGEDGDVPHGADLEKLAGLGLHALGCVDDHDRGVGCHQGAVGVLREVLVAGGIQNIDAVSVILELHDRRGHRDAALLLDLHPVGGGGAGVLLALDLTGLGDGPSVEEELFGQGRLTGVGVADDGERAPALDFRFVF